MSLTPTEARRMHAFIEDRLDEIAAALPQFTHRTVILRDPERPSRYSIITNEDDEIVANLKAAFGADDSGETVSEPDQ